MDLYDAVRSANLCLSVVLFATCMMRIVRDWGFWTDRERVVRKHLAAYLFVLSFGTVQVLAQGTAPGSRVFLLLAVHISFAFGLWRTRHDSVH